MNAPIETAIPTEIAAAIAAHHHARAEYQTAAATCTSLAANIARNRQAAAAAKATAAAAGQQWRADLRANDGQLTTAIKKTKAQSYQDNELATEYQAIADEMSDVLYERQYACNQSREIYQASRLKAEVLYLTYRFKLLSDRLWSTADGQQLLQVIGSINSRIDQYPPLLTDPTLAPRGHVPYIERVLVEGRNDNLHRLIANPVVSALQGQPALLQDDVMLDLAPIPRSPAEGKPGDFSIALRNQRRQNQQRLAAA